MAVFGRDSLTSGEAGLSLSYALGVSIGLDFFSVNFFGISFFKYNFSYLKVAQTLNWYLEEQRFLIQFPKRLFFRIRSHKLFCQPGGPHIVLYFADKYGLPIKNYLICCIYKALLFQILR